MILTTKPRDNYKHLIMDTKKPPSNEMKDGFSKLLIPINVRVRLLQEEQFEEYNPLLHQV